MEALNAGFVQPNSQLVVPEARFTSCGVIHNVSLYAICGPTGSSEFKLQIHILELVNETTFEIVGSHTETVNRTTCGITSNLLHFSDVNLSFKSGQVLGLYIPVDTPTSLGYIQLGHTRDVSAQAYFAKMDGSEKPAVGSEVPITGIILGGLPQIALGSEYIPSHLYNVYMCVYIYSG